MRSFILFASILLFVVTVMVTVIKPASTPKVHTFECSPLPSLSKAPGETVYRNVIKCTEVGS